MTTSADAKQANQRARDVARSLLGGLLVGAGIGHLSWARTAFQAQVPGWVPGDPDAAVLLSGAVELALGITLVVLPRRWVGRIVAVFFVAVLPGNIAQFVGRKDAFGLNSDARRAVRLLFQPLLIVWALWCTASARCLTKAASGYTTKHERGANRQREGQVPN